MIQKTYATQQIAEELTKEAIAIWRQSNQAEHLEGLEKDPVVSLLMTALAYQEYIAENELSRLKAEVMEDFAQMLIPHDLTHAIPASMMVQTATERNVPVLELDSNQQFGQNATTFIPLLKTKVYQITSQSIERLDARRWKVKLNFKEPIKSLEGLAFVVNSTKFKDLDITIKGHPLTLVKPWQYADLPLAECFAIDTQLYNSSLAFDASATWFDLFALHNKRMFVIGNSKEDSIATDSVSLTFEFKGIDTDFAFDKTKLLLNTTVIVNVTQRSATLSEDSPIVHISTDEQLLHLLRPSSEQMSGGDTPFVIRRAATQRFNVNGLLRLLHCMLDKYSTDYYAFMQVERTRNGMEGARLYQWIKTLVKYVEEAPEAFTSGVYLILKKTERKLNETLYINYLTTRGSAANAELENTSITRVPAGLSSIETKIIGEPVPGRDEAQGTDAHHSLTNYFLITGNRIVTPADMKIFCYNELLMRYNIASSQVKNVSVRNITSGDRASGGFETEVAITLENDIFIKRSFADKIPQAELVLQKMMETRSTSMYPIRVNIKIE